MITLMLAVPACALAQSPLEAQEGAANKSQQETVDHLAAIQRELATIRAQQAAAEQRAARQESANNEYFTPANASQWVLAFFAAVAAMIAALSLRAIDKQAVETEKAANAAKTSANAARDVLLYANRPSLIIRPFTVEGIDATGHITTRLHSGEAWITNVGVLPATLEHFWVGWMQVAELPNNNPAITAVDNTTAPSTVLPGHRGKRSLPDIDVAPATFNGINNTRDLVSKGIEPIGTETYQTVFLYGYIKFSDAIGLRRTYFCYRYNAILGRFEPNDHPNYSYEE